jgi:2-hydroxychromene-2-carboxylate isomerase
MSPYSWFAAERIEQLLPGAQWAGVLAGAVFKANGRVSWGITEHRADRIVDCEARAAAHGLGPIRWPKPWPTSDLLIARAMIVAGRSSSPPGTVIGNAAHKPEGRGLLKPFALAAMRLAFLEGADLGDADAVLEAGRRTGIDAQMLRDGFGDPDVKDALRSVTEEALAVGVSGVPTVAIGQKLFWGDDRLEDAAEAHRSAHDR